MPLLPRSFLRLRRRNARYTRHPIRIAPMPTPTPIPACSAVDSVGPEVELSGAVGFEVTGVPSDNTVVVGKGGCGELVDDVKGVTVSPPVVLVGSSVGSVCDSVVEVSLKMVVSDGSSVVEVREVKVEVEVRVDVWLLVAVGFMPENHEILPPSFVGSNATLA